MDRDEVVAFCRSLRGATEGYPFGPEVLVFKAAGKMFALVGEASASLKCDPVLAVTLRDAFPSVTPGYHLNKRHWNTVQLDGSVPGEVLREWIEDSYALAIASVSRSKRAALG